MKHFIYHAFLQTISEGKKSLAILIDPDKFDVSKTSDFLSHIPMDTTYLFVGGSTVALGTTQEVAVALKKQSSLPIFLFPGDYTQLTPKADAVLFLSLLSGRNAEYLIGQQVKSIARLQQTDLEIISTGYILVDGGVESAVGRVTNTLPIDQQDELCIVNTALAGQYLGAKMIYLEAGSGAKYPVKPQIISAVKRAIKIPLLVGGGIRTVIQKKEAFSAGADLVVMGTAFEDQNYLKDE